MEVTFTVKVKYVVTCAPQGSVAVMEMFDTPRSRALMERTEPLRLTEATVAFELVKA